MCVCVCVCMYACQRVYVCVCICVYIIYLCVRVCMRVNVSQLEASNSILSNLFVSNDLADRINYVRICLSGGRGEPLCDVTSDKTNNDIDDH